MTERDEALLAALARFRLARTSDLIDLFFGDVRRDTAAARLRRLFDAGYLTVFAADLYAENVYALGPRAAAVFKKQGMSVRRPPRAGLDHHLAIVRTWVRLARIIGELDGLRLAVVRPDWDIRRGLLARSLPVIPDLLLEVADGEKRVRIAVEVDRATESLTLLERKLGAYARLGQAAAHLGLLLVAPEAPESRQRALRRLLERWPGRSALARDLADLERVLPLLLVSTTAPLTTSPDDKGRAVSGKVL